MNGVARKGLGVLALAIVALGGVGVAGAAAQSTWAVAEAGNEARYLVREQLAGLEFPNDAIGRTAGVTGRLVIGADGTVAKDASRFEIDLASLQSDEDRRDNYLRRRTLETETHPAAVFVPTAIRGLSMPLEGGERTFEIVGDLTIKQVTRPVTWTVTARQADGAVAGTAKTQFTFEEFGLTKPSLARLLSVADEIRLEYDFRLVPEQSTR